MYIRINQVLTNFFQILKHISNKISNKFRYIKMLDLESQGVRNRNYKIIFWTGSYYRICMSHIYYVKKPPKTWTTGSIPCYSMLRDIPIHILFIIYLRHAKYLYSVIRHTVIIHSMGTSILIVCLFAIMCYSQMDLTSL